MPGVQEERDHVRHLIREELCDYDPDGRAARRVGHGRPMSPEWHRRTLADFRAALVDPYRVEVNFPGGLSRICWTVTRTNGSYRVVWVPRDEVFSLAVESRFGPVDIGVHGDAMGCFGSV